MITSYNNPTFVKAILAYYDEHYALESEASDMEAEWHAFNDKNNTQLRVNDFVSAMNAVHYAYQLADTLKREIDYIVTDTNTLCLLKNGLARLDIKYTNGVQEILTEVLRERGVIGPRKETIPTILSLWKTIGIAGTIAPEASDSLGTTP